MAYKENFDMVRYLANQARQGVANDRVQQGALGADPGDKYAGMNDDKIAEIVMSGKTPAEYAALINQQQQDAGYNRGIDNQPIRATQKADGGFNIGQTNHDDEFDPGAAVMALLTLWAGGAIGAAGAAGGLGAAGAEAGAAGAAGAGGAEAGLAGSTIGPSTGTILEPGLQASGAFSSAAPGAGIPASVPLGVGGAGAAASGGGGGSEALPGTEVNPAAAPSSDGGASLGTGGGESVGGGFTSPAGGTSGGEAGGFSPMSNPAPVEAPSMPSSQTPNVSGMQVGGGETGFGPPAADAAVPDPLRTAVDSATSGGSGSATEGPGWQKMLEKLGIMSKDGGIGQNAIPMGLNLGSQALKANSSSNLQKQLTAVGQPASDTSRRLLAEGASGQIPPGIMSQMQQTFKAKVDEITQRFANMGRDAKTDSAAQAEINKARDAFDAQVAQYSSGLTSQGLQAAGVAAGPLTQGALAGAQQDQALQQSIANFMQQMSMLQALQGRQTTPAAAAP